MRLHVLFASGVAVAVCSAALAADALAQEHFLAKSGQPAAVIVIGRDSNPFYRWVAVEVQRYIKQLSGAELDVLDDSQLPVAKTLIVVGNPETNPITAAAQNQGLVGFSGLRPEGLILQTSELDGRSIVVVGGADEAGTMNAAYELLERLGVVFQITGDIIPEQKPDLICPTLNVRMEPAFQYRGLHYRHFVNPLVGLDDFRRMIDQMAKLKYNCLEFYWYVGGPWIEYSHQGVTRQIDDLHTKNSGYLTWHYTAGSHTAADVAIGREHFKRERVCAPEFQHVRNQEEAHQVARQWLTEAIDYAHQRKIQVWLGAGDCPTVPPNLARHREEKPGFMFGAHAIPPGDSAGVEIWEAKVCAMIETYPAADGYWIWLSEVTFPFDDESSRKVLAQYDETRKLIPSLEDIRKAYPPGYGRRAYAEQIDADLGLLHYGKELIQRTRLRHPEAKLGLALLGRSYLFRALDSLVPKDVMFQSMESSVCWNRGSRVPMEYFGEVRERDVLVVPRLDDDESGFGMQFNVSLYEHDRVLAGLDQFGGNGAMAQVGKLRGLEQNAKYLAEGAWNPSLTSDAFYDSYLRRIFGDEAFQELSQAYQILEKNELAMGLYSTLDGFQGLSNFCSYADGRPIRMIRELHANPFARTAAPDTEYSIRWRQELTEAVTRLERAMAHLRRAQPNVLPGAQDELAYVLFKTKSYISHLQTICAILDAYVAYDAVVRATLAQDRPEMVKQFDAFRTSMHKALELAHETARHQAAHADEPTEMYILFRYNVRFVASIEQLCALMATWSMPN